jgi:hypothetical protein
MGFDISWLAVKGKNQQIILDQMGLDKTNSFGEFFDHPVTGFSLPDGWYLIVMDDRANKYIPDELLAKMSAGCIITTCQIEEYTMYSSVAQWENGKLSWAVVHDGDKAKDDLTVTGTPPEAFGAIRDDYAESQKEDDEAGEEEVDWYFEIPLELAKQITGFKHDEVLPGIPEDGFEILAPRKSDAAA